MDSTQHTMAHDVEIKGVRYIRSRDAAETTGYTTDYIARLAREGKIDATRIGRQWFVEPISLENFKAFANREHQKQRENLRAERRAERLTAERVQELNEQFNSSSLALTTARHTSALSALLKSAGVMLTGIVFGVFLYHAPPYLWEAQQNGTVARYAEESARTIYETVQRTSRAIAHIDPARIGNAAMTINSDTLAARTADAIPPEFTATWNQYWDDVWCGVLTYVDKTCARDETSPVLVDRRDTNEPVREQSVRTTQVVTSTPTYITNEYNTYPVTIVRNELGDINVNEIVTTPTLAGQADEIIEGRQEQFKSIGESFTTGALTVSGNTSLDGNTTVSGNLTVSGTQTFSDALSVPSFTATATNTPSSIAYRLGVGTTSPLAMLDVFGDAMLSGADRYLNFGATTTTGVAGYGFRDDAGTMQFRNENGVWTDIGSGGGAFVSGNGSTTLETISDNVGIGTTSPSAKLSVVGETLAEYFTATSTSATSTFPLLTTTALSLGSDYLTDLTGTGLTMVGSTLTVDDTVFLSLADWNATTTDALDEGVTNLYYTDDRVATYINGSSTIWNNTSEASLETFLSDVTNVFTNNDGALDDDDLTDDSITTLSDVDTTGAVASNILVYNGSDWIAQATSTEMLQDLVTLTGENYLSLGGQEITANAIDLATSNVTGTLPVARGGTGQTSFTGGQLLYGSGTGALQSIATTTPTIGSGLSYSGTFGALVGGAAGTLTVDDTVFFSLADWNATTTDALDEGLTNLYYTDNRVATYINGSSTIWNNTSESSLETFLSDVTNVFTDNDTITDANIASDLTIDSSAAITAPYFIADDASATSTFAGGFNVGSGGLVYDRETGRVGIGTTDPTALLSVSGDGYITGGLGVGVSTTTNGAIQTSGDVHVGGSLTVAGSLTSSVTNGQIQFLAVPEGTNIDEGTVYINPASAGTNNVLLGFAVGGTERVRVDAEGDIQVTGLFNSTNAAGTNQFSGNLSILGNTTLGNNEAADTLTLNSRVTGDILPSADTAYTLGSESLRFASIYAATSTIDNLVAGGTASSTFIINQGNTSADTQNSTLAFERGTENPNATLTWNATDDRFEFNDFPLYTDNRLIVNGSGTSSIAGLLTLTNTPTGSNLDEGALYINPSAAAADRTLLGIGVAGVERFKIDAEGDTTIQASLGIENQLYDITQDTLTINDNLQINGGAIKDSGGTTRLSIGSTNTLTGDLVPNADSTYDLGADATRFANVYADNFNASTFTTDLTEGSVAFIGAGGAISEDNANLFWDDATNRLGIGTANPGDFLEISDGSKSLELSENKVWSNDDFYVGTTEPNADFYLRAGGTTNGFTRIYIDSISGNVGVGDLSPDSHLEVSAEGTTGGDIFLLSSDDDNDGDLLTVTESGNVGIGTTSPAALLTVGSSTLSSIASGNLYNSAFISGDLEVGGTFYGTLSDASSIPLTQGYTLIGDASNNAVATSSLFVDTNGNVGIGTTTFAGANTQLEIVDSPSGAGVLSSSRLFVDNSGNNAITIGSGNSSTGALHFADDGSSRSGEIIYDHSDDSLSIRTGNTDDQLVIDSSGQVGIGTANPASALDIAGVVSVEGTQVIYNAEADGFTGSLFFGSGGTNLSNFFVGDGSFNTAVGMGALDANTTGDSNTASGYEALNSNTEGEDNTAVGRQALLDNTSGSENTAYGSQSLQANISGDRNTAIGRSALFNNTGDHNTASGWRALYLNTTGNQNTAYGYTSLSSNTTGSSNTASGRRALSSNTTGSQNAAYGHETLYHNVSATSTTALGYRAGFGQSGQTASENNVFLGYQAGLNNTTGNNNVLLGYQAGDSLTTGDGNILIGYDVDAPNVTDSDFLNIGDTIYGDLSTGNVGIGTTTPQSKLHVSSGFLNIPNAESELVIEDDSGNTYLSILAPATDASGILFGDDSNPQVGGIKYEHSDNSLRFETSATERLTIDSSGQVGIGTTSPGARLDLDTGGLRVFGDITTDPDADSNTFFGVGAGANNDTVGGGDANTFIGKAAGSSNTTGDFNTALGVSALSANTTGIRNVAIGQAALRTSQTGDRNVAVGRQALDQSDSNDNTAVGYFSLRLVSSGSGNIGLGYLAGDNITTGSNNITLGYNIDAPDATGSNQLNIGNLIFGTGIDGTGTTLSSGNIGIGTTSPAALLTVGSSTLSSIASGNLYNSAFISGDLEVGGTFYGTLSDASSIPLTQGYTLIGDASNNAAATSSLFVDTNGNVGVGNTAPSALLEVGASGGTDGELLVTSSEGRQAVLEADDSGNFVHVGSNTNHDFSIVRNNVRRFGLNSNGTSFYDTVGSTANLTVENGGNVGIGTTTPDDLLHLESSQATMRFVNNDAYADFWRAGLNNSEAFVVNYQGDASAELLIAQNGEVSLNGSSPALGIGVSDPGEELEVVGSDETTIEVRTTGVDSNPNFILTNDSQSWRFRVDGNDDLTIDNISGGVVPFTVEDGAPNNAFHIDSSGDLGLGTAAPVDKLHVLEGDNAGNSITLGSASYDTHASIGLDASDNAAYLFGKNGAGVQKFYIDADGDSFFNGGNVGIGTTSPSSLLDITGSDVSSGEPVFTLSTPNDSAISTNSQLGKISWSVDDNSAGRDRQEGAYIRYRASEIWNGTASDGYIGFGLRTRDDVFLDDVLSVSASTDGLGTSVGRVGVGSSTPTANLTVQGVSGQSGDLFTVASSTNASLFSIASGVSGGVTLDFGGAATATIMDGLADSFSIATSTTANSIFAIDTSGGPYATSTFSGNFTIDNDAFRHDAVAGETSIANLRLGPVNFEENAGKVSWIDLVVDANAATGTAQSYAAQLDSKEVLTIYGQSAGGGATEDIRVLVGSSTDTVLGSANIPDYSLLIANGALCVDDGGAESCDDSALARGQIYSESSSVSEVDLAENYPTKDQDLEKGEIVMFDPDHASHVTRYARSASASSSGSSSASSTQGSTQDAFAGVVSTAPGVLLGGFGGGEFADATQVPIALAGRVPVRINLEGGEIRPGDRITFSSVPGVGTRATTSGITVGIALESFTESDATSTASSTSGVGAGLVTVYVDSEYYYAPEQFAIDERGNVGIGTSTDSAYKLRVGGDIAATGFVNISSSSTKKEIENLDDARREALVGVIRGIDLATYRYDFENSSSTPKRFGLIAEQAPAEVLSADGRGVDLYKLSSLTLAGVQSVDRRLAILEGAVLGTTTGGTLFAQDGGLIATILESFKRFGVAIGERVTTITDLVAKNFAVGSAEQPSGITLYDEETGNPHCVRISAGELISTSGACEKLDTTLAEADAEDDTDDNGAAQNGTTTDDGTGSDHGTGTSTGTTTSTTTDDGTQGTTGTSTGTTTNADTTEPVIVLTGSPNVEVLMGDEYVEIGVSATDNVDGDITDQVEIGGDTVDTTAPGEYIITYNVTDVAGNAAYEVTRTVTVVDPDASSSGGSSGGSADTGGDDSGTSDDDATSGDDSSDGQSDDGSSGGDTGQTSEDDSESDSSDDGGGSDNAEGGTPDGSLGDSGADGDSGETS